MLSKTNLLPVAFVASAVLASSVLAFTGSSLPVQAVGGKLTPILECVISRDTDNDSIVDTYTAVWGYNNTDTDVISVPVVSNDNSFNPTPIYRGQPTDFNPGRSTYGLFDNNFTSGNVVWTLKSPDGARRTATATTTSKVCSVGTQLAHPYDPSHTY